MRRIRKSKGEAPPSENGQSWLWIPESRTNGSDGNGSTVTTSRLSRPKVALVLSLTLAIGAAGSWAITHLIDSRRARAVLAAETSEARQAGKEQGYADGRADGHQDGYDEGYETGRSEIGAASEDAYDKGFSEGREAGLARGKRLGNFAGWSEGYDEGWVDGCVSVFDDVGSARVYDEAGYWYLDRSQCIA